MAELRIQAEITGTVWKVLSQVGDRITEETEIMILESMKMEIPVTAARGGTLIALPVAEGQAIAEGDLLAVVAPD